MATPSLLAITPGDGRDLAPWVRALGEAGLPAILLREPMLPDPELRQLARFASHWVPQVIVHDRHPAARELGFPVHLPDDGRAPPATAFTASCHDEAGMTARLQQGARFVLLSPGWSPTSKPDDRRPALGHQAFLDLAAGRPVLALGGLDPARHRALVQAGAAGGAVLGDLFGQPSPAAAAERLAAYSIGE